MNKKNEAAMPKPTPKQLNEINRLIQEGINHWADIMLMADADKWSYLLEYEPLDLHNALFMLMHVASNIGFKAGFVCSEEEAEAMGIELRAFVEKYTGLDTHQLLEL